MNESIQNIYVRTLQRELIPALGCTEPIAIAYASAKARAILGQFPDRINLLCSGNIIKNVKGVAVPNAGGLRGVETAATLGVVGGDADRALEVLQSVTPEDLARTRELLKQGFCTCSLQENVANLFLVATVYAGEHSASVTIVNRHTLITHMEKDGEVLFHQDLEAAKTDDNRWSEWSIRSIIDFADTVDLDRVREPIERQIEMNSAISAEGLKNTYGAQIGRTLLDSCENTTWTRARARAAAGSDARMGGCSLPVVINSGSGNQGITITMPIVEYAEALGVSHERLLRAMLIGNLVSIYQKHFIGSLSAFCGAVTAAAGAGAAITYLRGGDYDAISSTIETTTATVGGLVCDGAKSSCAAKIASAVDAALMASEMSMRDRHFQPGEGIIQDSVEQTIRNVGYIGRVGMKTTDVEILNLMIGKVRA